VFGNLILNTKNCYEQKMHFFNLSFFQINNLHINITWSPPDLFGGPITAYNIHIKSQDVSIYFDYNIIHFRH
jgi:hypothetical protein